MSTATLSNAAARLEKVREAMAARGLDFFVVPSSDAHQSEYVPGAWQRRAWLTGFTGSMGNALVGNDGAWLWADSRYWLQAEAELDKSLWTLMRQGDHGVLSLARSVGARAAHLKVGYDPQLSSPAEARELRDAVAEAGGTLVAVDENPVDVAWAAFGDRPAVPVAPAVPWPDAYAGQSVAEKLAALREGTRQMGAEHLVMTTLDEIAWTFNLRGSDVEYNPVVIAWALVSPASATLFIDAVKVGPEVAAHLDPAGVRTAAYEAFGSVLGALDGKVVVDKESANQWVLDRLAASGAKAVLGRSPVQLPRARKNAREVDGMRAAHRRDGVAVVRFLSWLEVGWKRPGGLDELGAAAELERVRAEGERFRGLSFTTIAGFGPNGAIVHYRPTPATNRIIDDSTLFLLDSGAQYLDGTTDITRTVHLGNPTARQREHYTRVLRGHLALRHVVYPRGTTGTHLDSFARAPLWEAGLNFGHGTGHGVGAYLSVHQGPHRISPALNDVALEPGMVVSNEPGFYLTGEYGIRIENLVVVVPAHPPGAGSHNPYGPFFGFEDLTCVPYCRKLIEPTLLSPREHAQIDAYHAWVRDQLAPLVPDEARGWLAHETAPLAVAS